MFSNQVISELKRANIRPVMVTGDNVLTALSVARECRMIDHGQDVIILQASVTPDDSDAILSWYYADVPQSIEPITVVSFHLSFTAGSPWIRVALPIHFLTRSYSFRRETLYTFLCPRPISTLWRLEKPFLHFDDFTQICYGE